jgi:hypothetical protein
MKYSEIFLLHNKAVYWNSLFIISLFHDEKLIIAACVLSQNSKILSRFLSVNRDRQQYQFTRSTNSTNNFILPSKVPNKDGVGNSASLLTGEISSPAIKKPSIAAILQLLLKGSLFHDDKLIIVACVLSQNSKILSRFLGNKKYKIFISRFLNI